MTSFGAGNQLLYSFDSGYGNWFAEVQNLGYSFGFSPTEHNTLPWRALNDRGLRFVRRSRRLRINDVSATLRRTGPGISKLHIWVKLVTTDYTAINGIQSFIRFEWLRQLLEQQRIPWRFDIQRRSLP